MANDSDQAATCRVCADALMIEDDVVRFGGGSMVSSRHGRAVLDEGDEVWLHKHCLLNFLDGLMICLKSAATLE